MKRLIQGFLIVCLAASLGCATQSKGPSVASSAGGASVSEAASGVPMLSGDDLKKIGVKEMGNTNR
ncbi:MAG: hypothetical protein ACE5ER_09330 [Nitrospinaceae bacterium]